MSVAIVGTGLCSPAGMTPRDHAFFVRAREVLTPAPSPFVTDEDERVDVRYCPWIGARAPLAERMAAMTRVAVHEALYGLSALEGEAIPAFLCTDDGLGMPEAAVVAARKVVQQSLRSPSVTGCKGDAGSFAALRECISQIESGAARAMAVVAVDSYVDANRLAEALRVRPPYWESDPPEQGEGAAAIVLASPGFASARKLVVQGTLYGAAIAAGSATDENDEPVDGAALTAVFRSLPQPPSTVQTVFGQRDVSGLRFQEFQFAVARNASRFARVNRAESLESEIGRLGAAAGLANLVFGVATMRHGTMRNDAPPTSPFYAWAISRDGTRGGVLAAAAQA